MDDAVEVLGAAREALRRGDGSGALAALGTLAAETPEAIVLELVARGHYVDRSYPLAIEHLELAYAAYRAEGDHVGAVRAARTLACLHGAIMGDWAVGNGWLARAQRVLADSDDVLERGWVCLNLGMFESDRDAKHRWFRDALDVARAEHDGELEISTLAYLGASMVHSGDTVEGMRLLDEALAAIAGSEVEDFCVIEEVFCQLFSACEHASDVVRADQWISIGEAIAERRGLPAVSAFCRTHYGGVLTAAGRWDEADEALTSAIQLWALGRRSGLRVGAITRLADLRARQGRFDEASALLDEIDPASSIDAARPLAAVHLARGELHRAADILDAALEQIDGVDRSSAQLLELLVDVRVRLGDLEAARSARERLAACSDVAQSDSMRGALALATARIAAAGDEDAGRWYSDAVAALRRAQMPMEAAGARLEHARIRAVTNPTIAVEEARKAYGTFVELGAGRHADAAAALLRSLGVKVPSPRTTASNGLSKRETEVLELLGRGLSNPEIADRLYISRKTVEHHVGNVLAKLGLRSRAQAAAHAARLVTRNPGAE